MTEDNTSDPNATNTSLLAEEGVTLEMPPAKETAASVLTRKGNAHPSFVDSTDSTRLVLNRFDRNGDGIISRSEADIMAQANVLEEKEKKKYKFIAIITSVLLFLTLMANFGLTIATIYLTRQFDVEDGTLMDRSTGKQVTTKAHGNLIDATLFGEVDSTGRRLQNNLCFATISMDRAARDATYLNFLNGESVRYIIEGRVPQNGQVKFMNRASPIEMSILQHQDAEYFQFEANFEALAGYFEDNFGNIEDLMDEKDVDSETLVLYAEVECEDRSCPTLGTHSMFFMYCGGTPGQALFDTGNCCLVGAEQLNRDMRRLSKCVSDRRLKDNIEQVGISPSGIPVYTFKYRDDKADLLGDSVDTNSVCIGAMAQDLLDIVPEAVVTDPETGYYAVDYSKIDVDFRKVD